jgi:SOS-response transcriptional repressor LexA
MIKITDRQQEIYNYIVQRIKESYPPTRRELAFHFGITIKGAHDHCVALHNKGFIILKYKVARGFIIPKKGHVIEKIKRSFDRKRKNKIGAITRKLKNKPKKCYICGCSNKRIIFHHPDYSKAKITIPLCDTCHPKLHKILRIYYNIDHN